LGLGQNVAAAPLESVPVRIDNLGHGFDGKVLIS